jgi:copper chaperone NosL
MATSRARRRLTRRWPIVLAALVAAGCGRPAPRPLAEGTDVCDHCHMTMVERRFGGELVSVTGKVTPFDDVGCLAMAAIELDSTRIHSLWVSDFLEPDSLATVERMVFLRTDSVRTPMSYGIVAVRPGPRADSLEAALGATRLAWSDVVGWARGASNR